ncbi:MAG: ECF transporter S component [Eubacterium sp.]
MHSEESLDSFLDNFLEGKAVERETLEKSKKTVRNRKKDERLEFDGADEMAWPSDVFVEPPADHRLSKRTKVSLLMIFLMIPFVIWFGINFMGDRKYYFISTVIIVLTIVPFLMVFEGRKPQAREIVVLAVIMAIAVMGRMAFFMLPQFKPVTAIVIVAGVCFGAESGLLVGVTSGMVSNFFFGQGPWTPWQMLAFGIVGFLAGVLFQKGLLKTNRRSLCLYGFLSTFFIYGFIMNTSAAFMVSSADFNLLYALPYYITGAPMDLIHAASTAFFLFIIAKPMIEKLERIKKKYGLIQR